MAELRRFLGYILMIIVKNNYQPTIKLATFICSKVFIVMSILTYSLLILIIPYAASLNFSFSSITSKDSGEILTAGGGAYLSDEGIQVTPEDDRQLENRRQGRATYFRPLHLWDKTSNELANFSTSFSFVIDSKSKNAYADGLTFFLAENNSFINSGGAMGLPIDSENNVLIHPFVAVEFDTYKNPKWDDAYAEHVGININSLISARYKVWWSNITAGRECNASITYDSVSTFLNVSFTGFQNNTAKQQVGLNYTIDLREVLPEWVIFGFSAATGQLFEKNNVKTWTFKSSVLRVDESVKGKKGTAGYVEGLIAGACVVVALLAMVAIICWRKRENKGNEAVEVGSGVEMNNEFEMSSTRPRRFSHHELARATGGFAGSKKLGEGGFGEVYKGFLEDSRTYVAVKRVSKGSKQGIKEYASEVNIISRLRHRNLVKLIGWCHDNGELLLIVYEFMEKGSLDLHLFKGKSLLTWGTRYKIARDLASALLYLHEEWEQCVLHRDIKSSNVMLDSNFNAKLGDFGLAKLVDHEKGSQTTMLAGTLGYMAPECAATGKASRESDVFSFGVVALEIACGRKPIEETQKKLVEWVWELYGRGTGTLLDAADPRLGSDYEVEDIKRLMIVGLWCVHPDPHLRPSMRQAIHVLKYEASVPLLPSKMPVASYVLSPTSSYAVASLI